MRRNSVVRKVVRGYRKGERYAMHCEIVPMETVDPGMLWGGEKKFNFC